jgi:hypothetical protein
MFRFKKPSTATYAAPATTYSAPSTTAAALTITWTANEPTASTTITIADGDAVTSVETGQAIHDLNTQTNALVADIAALAASIAENAVDVAATNTKLAALAVDVAGNTTVLAEGN